MQKKVTPERPRSEGNRISDPDRHRQYHVRSPLARVTVPPSRLHVFKLGYDKFKKAYGPRMDDLGVVFDRIDDEAVRTIVDKTAVDIDIRETISLEMTDEMINEIKKWALDGFTTEHDIVDIVLAYGYIHIEDSLFETDYGTHPRRIRELFTERMEQFMRKEQIIKEFTEDPSS